MALFQSLYAVRETDAEIPSLLFRSVFARRKLSVSNHLKCLSLASEIITTIVFDGTSGTSLKRDFIGDLVDWYEIQSSNLGSVESHLARYGIE